MTATTTSTLSRFPAAAEAFVRDLYVEHLEEAAFLYDQRNYIIEHIAMEPHDIAWNELRCDRHLDALVAGGELTLTMCKERSASGEEGGELYTAMRVFCRANRSDLVKTVLDELDTEDAEMLRAAGDGLKHELPQSWSARVSQWLDEADEPRAAILAVASAYRRLGVGPAIVLKASGPLTNPVPFLWALGRLREPTAALLFQKYLQDGDDEARQAAAIAALRCGDQRVVGALRQAATRGEAWAAVPLSLLGELSDFAALERMATPGSPNAEVALALGLLGHVSAVDALLHWLETDDVAESAAIALHLLTGLYPVEAVSANDTANVESLSGGDESEEAEGSEGDSQTTALAQSRATWELSCTKLHPELKDNVRTQFGEADSMTPSLRGVASPRLPIYVRNLLTDALLVRHDVYASPCDDWSIVRQVQIHQRGSKHG